MKKKIITIVLLCVFLLSLGGAGIFLSTVGWSATLEDADDAVTDLARVIFKGDLTTTDWKVDIELNDKVIGQAISDGQNAYEYNKSIVGGKEVETTIWAFKAGEGYNLYTQEGEEKFAERKSTEDIEDRYISGAQKVHENLYLVLYKSLKECRESSKTTCEVNKTLLGKITITINTENTETIAVLKKGYIQSITSIQKSSSEKHSYTFEYKDQKITLPNTEEFTQK